MRWLAGLFSSRPSNFVWVTGGVAGSGRPTSRASVRWLHSRGIRAIVSLNEKGLPKEWIQGLDVKYAHILMKDHAQPEPEVMQKAVEAIEASLIEGRNVLVHCAGGKGRTGCVLASFIVKTRGLSAEEAIKFVRIMRPSYVERRQEAAVKKHEEYMKAKGSASRGP